jgi:protein-tyrosine phosphatase
MTGYVDLHCHFLPDIDDGPDRVEDALCIIEQLHGVGFDLVIATPHMRPGLYDNSCADIQAAFERMQPHLQERRGLPRIALASEHYFDDVVFRRLLTGDGLPYPGGHAVLIELSGIGFPPNLEHRLADLRRRGLLPVIAHPERYQWLWQNPDLLQRAVDAGAAALLNAAALAGANGSHIQQCAEELLDRGLYHAACSDAHALEDVDATAEGLARIEQLYGGEEIDFLLREGPVTLLGGVVPE